MILLEHIFWNLTDPNAEALYPQHIVDRRQLEEATLEISSNLDREKAGSKRVMEEIFKLADLVARYRDEDEWMGSLPPSSAGVIDGIMADK